VIPHDWLVPRGLVAKMKNSRSAFYLYYWPCLLRHVTVQSRAIGSHG
jgi:hypothetical protein